MDMIGKVRRMSLRDKRSNSEIAKLTGLSLQTNLEHSEGVGAGGTGFSKN